MIVGIIFIGMGVIAIIVGLAFIIPYKNVRRFASSKVQGQIVDMVWDASEFNQPREDVANVEQFSVGGVQMRVGTRSRMGGEPPTANMYHKVYRYVVDGKEYMRADGVRYNKGAVKEWLGKTVPVYYNPENPQQSTLSNGKGYKITMIALYSIGGVFILMGVGEMVLAALFSSFM